MAISQPTGYRTAEDAVGYLAAEAGVTQFLDIGAGLAMSGSTHEIAQRLTLRSRAEVARLGQRNITKSYLGINT
jgi:hypothetical protein